MRDSGRARATLMLTLLTLVWGLTFPATKAALALTTPLQFLALRFLLGAGLFALVAIIKARREKWSMVTAVSRNGLAGWSIGSLLLISYILQASGLLYTTASRSGFFTGLLTLLAPIFALLFGTSRAPVMVWVALPVALTGIFLLADPDVGGLNRGDWLTIGCAAVFALQMIALEAVDRRSRRGGRTTDGLVEALSLVQMLTVGLGCAILALAQGVPLRIDATGWWAVIYTGVFGSLIAVWLQTKYQPLVPAGFAGVIFTLEPLWAALFAWMILGDTWTSRGLLGAGAIIIAMVISNLKYPHVEPT